METTLQKFKNFNEQITNYEVLGFDRDSSFFYIKK